MASQFLLQIVDKANNKVVSFDPGGPVEKELVAELSRRLLDKQVGVFSTRAQVAKVVEDTLREMILELKKKI